MRKVSLIPVVILLITGLTTHAQRRATRASDRQVGPTLQRIETRTQAFRNSLSGTLIQSRLNGAWGGENINEFISEFEAATARFRERFDNRQAVAADAQELIDRASSIDSFMRRRQLDAQARRDWGNLRFDLDQLARYYSVSWRQDELGLYTGVEGIPTRPDAIRGDFTVPDGTQLVAVLNENLSTQQAQEGERFTLKVRLPSRYEGAIIEGAVARVNRSGRVSGRAEMSFEFDRIRLQDGRTSNFAGYIDSVRTTSGETIRVDNKGRVQDDDSQTSRTVTRTGIGAAVGAGGGSVYVQGRENLDLLSGTEFMIRASAPR